MGRAALRYLLILGAGLAPLTATAQQARPDVIPCATMEQDSINRARFPQRGTLDEFENLLQKKIREISLRGNGRTAATVVTFPVVVHIIHNGEPVGTGTNISAAQVQAQMEVLNEDFRRKVGTPGFNNSPVGADIEVEFCLSPVDVAGNQLAEPGIHRYNGGQTAWTRQQIDGSLKPTTIWNPNVFYNIWTLNFGGQDAILLGYAQFPDKSGLEGLNSTGGPATTDGVVVKYSSFGSIDKGTFPVMQPPYNRGRTLSHETGHWLGLRHIWGDGLCGNDFVDDTPESRAENRGCPANKLACDGVTFEMVQNYMDYTDDACMNIFTVGQKARILAVLELSPRRKASAQALCGNVVAAAPVANFTVDKQLILKGGEAAFTDLSSNFPTTWSWEFQGGDPNTSNVQNPRVKYTTPGTYSVTLTASNSLGDSTLTMTDFINVSEEGLCATTSNYSATFTPSVIKLSSFGNFAGYLTGHNSVKSKALTEFFTNPQGYSYISGVQIKFGKAIATTEDAKVTVTVWNARGAQNGPGSVIERKELLFKQIIQDMAAGNATSVIFDRETPVFSRPFHVGVELSYSGDSLAITSSADGEATSATAWNQDASGVWSPYSISYGANIAMDIKAVVGMNTSVQVAASKLFINPGDEVILNARGASIFLWNSSDNKIQNVAGPQLIVRPVATTTYETTGTGLDLCNNTALTTIFVKEGPITAVQDLFASTLKVFPNPGNEKVHIVFEDTYVGDVGISIHSMLGQSVMQCNFNKEFPSFEAVIDATGLNGGLYVVRVKAGGLPQTVKWLKK